jgi:hypothetical protein
MAGWAIWPAKGITMLTVCRLVNLPAALDPRRITHYPEPIRPSCVERPQLLVGRGHAHLPGVLRTEHFYESGKIREKEGFL